MYVRFIATKDEEESRVTVRVDSTDDFISNWNIKLCLDAFKTIVPSSKKWKSKVAHRITLCPASEYECEYPDVNAILLLPSLFDDDLTMIWAERKTTINRFEKFTCAEAYARCWNLGGYGNASRIALERKYSNMNLGKYIFSSRRPGGFPRPDKYSPWHGYDEDIWLALFKRSPHPQKFYVVDDSIYTVPK